MAVQLPDKRGDLPIDPTSQDWASRIRPGVYTSPSGKQIAFHYEGVSREIDLRRAVFEFSGVDGVYIQQHGIGARRYPLRCYFTGKTCDLEATAFEEALCETGVGHLGHPLYSSFDVIPMGTIRRTDNLVGELNQSVVEIEFWPSLPAVYPTLEKHPQNELTDAWQTLALALAQGYADNVTLDTLVKQSAMKSTMRRGLDQIRGATRSVTRSTAAIERQFIDLQTTINLGLDDYLLTPQVLAEQVLDLFWLPAQVVGDLQNQLDAFGALAESVMTSPAGDPASHLLPSAVLGERVDRFTNDFYAADFLVVASVGASVRACIGHEFATRPEALRAAATVVEQYDAVVTWRDTGYAAISSLGVRHFDHGGAIQALMRAVLLCAGQLVRASFTLYPEIRITLDRPRTILDLAAQLFAKELKGAPVDSKLDELIQTNDLSGDEILELPTGREIVYYRRAA